MSKIQGKGSLPSKLKLKTLVLVKFRMFKIGVHGVMVIATAERHSRKSELRFFTGLNPAGIVSELWDCENFNNSSG